MQPINCAGYFLGSFLVGFGVSGGGSQLPSGGLSCAILADHTPARVTNTTNDASKRFILLTPNY